MAFARLAGHGLVSIKRITGVWEFFGVDEHTRGVDWTEEAIGKFS